VPLYAGTAKAGLLPIRVAWTVRRLLLLSSCSARKRTELTWTWSLPSRETTHEEVLWSLAVLAVVLLMRRLLMRFFSAGLRSSFQPWAEAGPLKGPRSRWTGIPRYPEHRQGCVERSGLGLPPHEVFLMRRVLHFRRVSVVLLARCLLTRVLLVGPKSASCSLSKKTGPLNRPRSRWTGIPQNPVHR
jgi:hypothetical protein